MPIFYFTYGLDPAYPFQGGWTTIEAPDQPTACALFQAFHPNVPEHCPSFEDVYTEDEFIESDMSGPTGNLGAYCHELIVVYWGVFTQNQKDGGESP